MNKRTAPEQRPCPNRNHNDLFLPSSLMQNVNRHANKQYGYQRSYPAVPSNAKSGMNQRISGSSRCQTAPVRMPNDRMMQRVPFEQSLHDRCFKRVLYRIEETFVPILKFTEFPEDFLTNVLLPCIPSEKAGILVAGVLLCASKKMGTDEIGKFWRESQLRWIDLFGDHPYKDFIKKNKLEFLDIPRNLEVQMACPNAIETLRKIEEIKKDLLKLLAENVKNEMVFDNIDMRKQLFRPTESTFIRALVLAVHESAISKSGFDCKLNTELLNYRLALLNSYIDHDEHLELQALYALQSLMNKLGQPNGILRQIFDILFDKDVVTEEVFKTWESSTDPNEMEGKGIAASSVKSFFTWLRETEDSDDDAYEW